MKRSVRRFLLVAAGLVGVLLAILAIGVALLLAEPAFYHAPALSPEQAESAAKRVEDKLVEIRNVTVERRAAPASSYVVTFTQDELNAFLAKWSELSHVRAATGGQVRRPMVILRPDELILAAKIDAAGMQAVAAVHLRPTLDDAGLRLPITAVTAGRLPVPPAQLLARLKGPLEPMRRRLPDWQAAARLNAAGHANDDATKALYARLLLAAVDGGHAVEPVLLVPSDGHRAVPVRLTEVSVAEGELTLRARMLAPAERAAFLASLQP